MQEKQDVYIQFNYAFRKIIYKFVSSDQSVNIFKHAQQVLKSLILFGLVVAYNGVECTKGKGNAYNNKAAFDNILYGVIFYKGGGGGYGYTTGGGKLKLY